ncbi:class I SAM-dependent methyltransferase [archaeon]|jgi:hypothetical protein|nr:class I SAM-dependent methyltransferase [archaeon]MBT4352626.1 class I SAM-dependent methyltransferase [archaeon]MBT6182296.1 class I SAM-dependent methyltransferase [archaeon]MBT6606092.1 class I SAM-dependent methyltransferase [archaeon]MBT7252068.1 class I SAM-dependent methyltransferase [archaeon]
MKKVLVLGVRKGEEHQHKANDYFKNSKKIYVDLKNSDVNHNLNEFPYPFKDHEFDGIFASHIVEHIRKDLLIKFMEELWRICKNKSKIYIFVPHFSNVSTSTHPTHYGQFGRGTFDYFCDNCEGWEKYLVGKFDLIYKKVVIPRRFFFVRIFGLSYWENYLSSIFPAHEIKFILEIKK